MKKKSKKTSILTDEIKNRVGEKLKNMRLDAGYKSYEVFAFQHDISRVQYWRLETGRSNFTIDTLVRIVNMHGMTIVDFLKSL